MSFTEAEFKNHLVLLREIENQSDRGSAIVGTAWVEELRTTIKSKLVDDDKVWGRLDHFLRVSI